MFPPWVAYVAAAVCGIAILAQAVQGPGSLYGVGGDLLFAGLVALGAMIPLALVLWGRGSSVRLCEAGIVSIGLNTAHTIRWEDLDRFAIDSYRSTPFAIYAVLIDGSRVALEPLWGRSWQQQRIGRICQGLNTKLAYERQRLANNPVTPPAFPRIPLGWRLRPHGIERSATLPRDAAT
jgi:hypothetical protein